MALVKIKYNRGKLNKFERNVKDLISQWKKRVKIADEKASELMAELIEKEMPKITGNLRNSVSILKIGEHKYIIGHDKDLTRTADGKHSYGDIVYYGIKEEYTFGPKNAKALRFVIGGTVIFAKKVTIPPRPGNKFIDRAEKEAVGPNGVRTVYIKELKKIKHFK